MNDLIGQSPDDSSDASSNGQPVTNDDLNQTAGTQDLSPEQLNQMFHLAAQAALQHHMTSNGGTNGAPSAPSPALSRIPVQGGPGFMQRFGSAMLGHPMDPNANSVVATNQAPADNAYGIPAPRPIAPGQYSLSDIQKYSEEQAKAAQMHAMFGMKGLDSTVANLALNGDANGAISEFQRLHPGQPVPPTLGTTVTGAINAKAKQVGAAAQSSRATTYDNQFWDNAGQSLAGLKGNVTFTQQSGKVSSGFHLAQLLDSSFNKDTGEFDLSPSQYGEVVLNGAAMLTGTSNFTNEQMQTIRQMTAKGQLGAAMTYLTGTPFNGNSQDVIKQVAQLAVRQGTVAQDLRDQMIQGQNGALAQAKATNPTAYARTVENALGKAPDLRSKLNSSPWVASLGGLPSNTVTTGASGAPAPTGGGNTAQAGRKSLSDIFGN